MPDKKLQAEPRREDRAPAAREAKRKIYHSPKLIKWGSFTRLTHGPGGAPKDGQFTGSGPT